MALRKSVSTKVKAGAPVITRRDLPDGDNNMVVLAGMPLTIVNDNVDSDDFEGMTQLERLMSFTKFELCRYTKSTGSKATKDQEFHSASWVFSGVKQGEYGDFADPSYDLGLLNPQVPDGWNGPPKCFSLSVAYPVLRNAQFDDFGNYINGTGEIVLLELPQDAAEPEYMIAANSKSLAGLMFNKLTGAGKRQSAVDGAVVQLDGPLGTIINIKKDSKAAPRDMYVLEVTHGVANPDFLTQTYREDVEGAVSAYNTTGMKRWAYYNALLDNISDDGSNIGEVALDVVSAIRVKILDTFEFFYDATTSEGIAKAWAEKLDLMTIEATSTIEVAEEAVQRVPMGQKRKRRPKKEEDVSVNPDVTDDDIPF